MGFLALAPAVRSEKKLRWPALVLPPMLCSDGCVPGDACGACLGFTLCTFACSFGLAGGLVRV